MKRLSVNEQLNLIEFAVRKKHHLSDVLKERGLSYDSLVYSDGVCRFNRQVPDFVPVDERSRKPNGIKCVSFFSGAGGLDIGFKCAGFENIIDVELNDMFGNTLKANGAKDVIIGDMNDYPSVIKELEQRGIRKNFPGVFHGGPPCQSFSVAANQRFSKGMEKFKRTGFNNKSLGNLLFCYIEVIRHFTPETFLIENVDGLLTIDNGEQVTRACKLLRDVGYDVTPPRIVNAADYGVPQKRMRTFIVGSRIGHFVFPNPSPQFPAGSVFKRTYAGLQNHVSREHSSESITRYMKLAFGERDKLGRVDRIDPYKPSKTIIAGGMKGGGRSPLHPFIPRTMTVRECARIQTFPDSYIFTGPIARQFTQVGNAVPPVLAYEMACAIYDSIYARSKGPSEILPLMHQNEMQEEPDFKATGTDNVMPSYEQMALFEKEANFRMPRNCRNKSSLTSKKATASKPKTKNPDRGQS